MPPLYKILYKMYNLYFTVMGHQRKQSLNLVMLLLFMRQVSLLNSLLSQPQAHWPQQQQRLLQGSMLLQVTLRGEAIQRQQLQQGHRVEAIKDSILSKHPLLTARHPTISNTVNQEIPIMQIIRIGAIHKPAMEVIIKPGAVTIIIDYQVLMSFFHLHHK